MTTDDTPIVFEQRLSRVVAALGVILVLAFAVLFSFLLASRTDAAGRMMFGALVIASLWLIAQMAAIFIRPRRNTVVLTAKGISQPYAARSPIISWSDIATVEDTPLHGILVTSRIGTPRIRVVSDLRGLESILREIYQRVPICRLEVPTELRAPAFHTYAYVANAILVGGGCLWILSRHHFNSETLILILVSIGVELVFFWQFRSSPRRLTVTTDALTLETRRASLHVTLSDLRQVSPVSLRDGFGVRVVLSSGKTVVLPSVRRRQSLALYGFLLKCAHTSGSAATSEVDGSVGQTP